MVLAIRLQATGFVDSGVGYLVLVLKTVKGIEVAACAKTMPQAGHIEGRIFLRT